MMRNAGRSIASREESIPRAARILLPVLLWLGLLVAPPALAIPAAASAACAIPRHGSEQPPVESTDSATDEEARPAEGENDWRIVAERQLPATTPRGAQVIDVEIKERSFALDRQTVSGPDVVLRGENLASEDHEMLVLRYAPGYSSADLLRATGPDLPSEVTYVGEIPVRAGSARDLVLVDLEPGVYTLVCLFPDADGIPHLAYGMEATFTVE
jgi:hypothetical protein